MKRRSLHVALVVGLFALSACGSSSGVATSSASPSSAPSSASTPSSTGTATGSCTYVDAATVQLDTGIAVATVTQIQNGCLFESASGTHDAQSDVKYLHGHDGVILGIATGTFSVAPTCQQSAIPGISTPGAVCQELIATGSTIIAFELSGGRVGTLIVFAPTQPSLDQDDKLAVAAYPKMLAG
ncbi:MAG: hypothetical protein ACHQ0J_10645 [Candidatus Dormibacterales bacterium]